ncbi:MAG: hypothetical protein JJT94_11355 [Bernardetiaceae bacterium]|nr:hypothetical protein [Bernardetiaceae bacterium]
MIEPEKIYVSVREILANNDIFISQVSLFEIAIKQKIGKLPALDLPINLYKKAFSIKF